jgi:hypothetical protein
VSRVTEDVSLSGLDLIIGAGAAGRQGLASRVGGLLDWLAETVACIEQIPVIA